MWSIIRSCCESLSSTADSDVLSGHRFDHDPNWSETSERYVLKLFRDYVFHQTDAQGKPVTDLSHVLMCLNKLDAGLDEKIMLVSRDEQTCIIVSYAEVSHHSARVSRPAYVLNVVHRLIVSVTYVRFVGYLTQPFAI